MHTSVLVADHHCLLRQGLRSLLNSHGEFRVIGEARDSAEALEFIAAGSPDLLLIDSNLPSLGGTQTAMLMKRRMPGIRIVMLTGFMTEDWLRNASRTAAVGCVSRDASFEELLTALRRAVSVQTYASPAVPPLLARSALISLSNEGSVHERIAKLTERERSILLLIVEGCTNRATAQQLSVSQKTVEKHRASLMRKIGVHNATELMIAAMKLGIIDRPPLSRPRTAGAAHEAGSAAF